MIPQEVLKALQAHIDRESAALRHELRDNTEACNALTRGKELGKLQQWIFERENETTP